MRKFKHTPEPWLGMVDGKYSDVSEISIESDDVDTWVQIHNGKIPIAVVVGHYDNELNELDANARLIASAPDLLDALQRIATGIPEHRDGAYFTDCYAEDGTQLSPESHNPVDIINSIVGVAMAAILKATGDL